MRTWLDRNKDIGILIFRIFLGARIIYGVVDNVFSWERMLEFRQFLQAHRFPVPVFSAVISVYGQLLGGLLVIAGWKIRTGCAILIANFLVAIFAVHLNDSFEVMTPALAMLFGSVLLLFTGAGRYSLDNRVIFDSVSK